MTENNTKLKVLQEDGDGKKWPERKMDNKKVAESFRRLGNVRKAERLEGCGTWLNFSECAQGHRKLTGANFCRARLCPVCDWRRSLKHFGQIMDIVHEAHRQQPKLRYIFLTLTVKNVPSDELSGLITRMFTAWNVFAMYDEVYKASVGWIRALEVTYNPERDDYHPHFHVMIGVKQSYFTGKRYISQARWAALWQRALGVDYIPMVHVEIVKPVDITSGSGIAELSKYTIKDSDYILEDKPTMDKVVGTLSVALHHRRLVGFGKLFRKIKAELALPDVEASDADLTDGEVFICSCPVCGGAIFQTVYNWRIGYNQYMLCSKSSNPQTLHIPKTGGEKV